MRVSETAETYGSCARVKKPILWLKRRVETRRLKPAETRLWISGAVSPSLSNDSLYLARLDRSPYRERRGDGLETSSESKMVARSLFSTSCVLLAVMIVALVSTSHVDAFIVEMASHSQECYYEYVRTKRTAFLKIGVLESQDQYDIRLKAYGPFVKPPAEDDMSMGFFDQMVTTQRDQTSNDVQHNGFNFESEHRGGYYKFCLDNTHSAYEGKIVEFYTSFDLSNEEDLGHEDELEKYARQRTTQPTDVM